MLHIKLSTFELVWRCSGRGRTPQRARGPHTKERCAEATIINDNEALWRDHNSLRLLCERDSDGLPVSYFKKCFKKNRVYASISA